MDIFNLYSCGWLFLDIHCYTIIQSNIVSGVVVSTIWTHDSLMLPVDATSPGKVKQNI